MKSNPLGWEAGISRWQYGNMTCLAGSIADTVSITCTEAAQYQGHRSQRQLTEAAKTSAFILATIDAAEANATLLHEFVQKGAKGVGPSPSSHSGQPRCTPGHPRPARRFDEAPDAAYNGEAAKTAGHQMGSRISIVVVMSPTRVLIWLQHNPCAYSSADRASVFGTEGRGFESLWARHFLRLTPALCYPICPSTAGSANLLPQNGIETDRSRFLQPRGHMTVGVQRDAYGRVAKALLDDPWMYALLE